MRIPRGPLVEHEVDLTQCSCLSNRQSIPKICNLTWLSLLGHRAERKCLVFEERGVKGLPYTGAAIFAAAALAAVIRGGDSGGSIC
jgi:hypothetical protein